MSIPAAPDDAVHAAIAAAIRDHRTRKVPIAVILAAGSSVDRSAASDPTWRRRVRASIDRLAATGAVELPRTKWDRRTEPPLPDYVLRPQPPTPERTADGPIVWHAELGWVPAVEATRRLSAQERQLLTATNAWMSKRTGIVVPIRERSLQLLGDEKALEQIRRRSRLFADGHLTLAALDCELCWPPVDYTAFGDGPWVIVENWTTYATLRRAAARDGWEGCLVYGSGMQVTTRLAALADLRQQPPAIAYFGDIDGTGFAIARAAAATADELGLAQVRPAARLYELLLDNRVTRRINLPPNREVVEWSREWLGGTLGDDVASLLTARCVAVQEAVNWETFASTTLPELLD